MAWWRDKLPESIRGFIYLFIRDYAGYASELHSTGSRV